MAALAAAVRERLRAGEELDLTGLDDAALALLVRIVAVRDVRA